MRPKLGFLGSSFSRLFFSQNCMPSSPTLPIMSSCLTGGSGGGRAYRFELDIVAKSSSPSPRSSHSSPSSTLSELSNSTPLFTSTKRARAPRKRPNQCSAEAAALLATVYPKLFSASNLRQPISLRRHPPDDPFPALLPSFPIPGDGGLLLREPSPSPETPLIGPEVRPAKLPNVSICSPPDYQDPVSPDFDAESILDEEVEEGIDSIMGNLSMSPNHSKDEKGNCSSNSLINPYLASLVGFGIIGSGFGFGFGISSNIRHALRQTDDREWWRTPAVVVKDIVGSFTAPPMKTAAAHKKKKKKKMVEKEAGVEAKAILAHASPPGNGILKPQLGLKLNYDDFLKLWCGGSPFSDGAGSPESAADAIARLADIDLFPDTDGGAVREASVQRYKEKRRTRLFSKKIRYQVRKVNADQRPRMKGRFVRTPSLFQEAMGEAQS